MNRSLARLITLALALLIAALAPQPAIAAYGELDKSFGKRGMVKLPKRLSGDAVQLRVQKNGKILIRTSRGNLFQLNRNGTLDRKFANEGLYAPPANTLISDVELLAGGRTVVLANGPSNSTIARSRVIVLHRNGKTDRSFARSGSVTLGTGVSGFRGQRIAIQPGLGIVVAGVLDGSQTTVSMVRIGLDGEIDRTFANEGTATVTGATSNFSNYGATAVAVGSRGEILLGLDSWATVRNGGGVARFSKNGTLDTSFGIGGVAIVSLTNYIGARPLGVSSISVAENGGLAVLGGSYLGNGKGSGPAWVANFFSADGRTLAASSAVGAPAGLIGLHGSRFMLSAGGSLAAFRGDSSSDPRFDSAPSSLKDSCEEWGPGASGPNGTMVVASTVMDWCFLDRDDVPTRTWVAKIQTRTSR